MINLTASDMRMVATLMNDDTFRRGVSAGMEQAAQIADRMPQYRDHSFLVGRTTLTCAQSISPQEVAQAIREQIA